MNNLAYILIFLLASSVFAEEERCDVTVPAVVNCDSLEQALPGLQLLRQWIKDRYRKPEAARSFEEFNQDVAKYLEYHNKLAACPAYQDRCPSFSFKRPLDGRKGIIESIEASSFSSPCRLARPMTTYYGPNDQMLANGAGSSISLKIRSNCGGGKHIGFAAYEKGLLAVADIDHVRWESNAVGRRIDLGAKGTKVSAPDEGTLRITWEVKDKEKWIDISVETLTFKESNFMKVDQLNSGNCRVEKQVKPKNLCEKMRKELLKRGSINSPEEYECFEYVPTIEGIPSRVSRG